MRSFAPSFSALLALHVATMAACKVETPNRSDPAPRVSASIAATATPVVLADGGAIDVCVGKVHSCAIDDRGVVRCWGENEHGQLGPRAPVQTSVPTVVEGVPRARRLACGAVETCALSNDGEVWCWGYQVGFTEVQGRPFRLPFTGRVRDFRLSMQGGCAVGDDGKVRCYARHASLFDDVELPGVGGVTSLVEHDLLDGSACALREGRPPVCFRTSAMMRPPRGGARRASPAPPVTYVDVTDPAELPRPRVVPERGPLAPEALPPLRVAHGYDDHACGIDGSGKVHCWGRATSGQLGDRVPYIHPPAKVPGIDDALSLSVGEGGACVARREGTLVCWGRHDERDPPLPMREIDTPFRADEVAVGASLLDAARICAREAGSGTWRCRFGEAWLTIPKRFVGRPKPALLDARGGTWNLELKGPPTPTFYFSQIATPVVAVSHDGYCAVDEKGAIACGHCGACDSPRRALTTIRTDEPFVLVSSLFRDERGRTSTCGLTDSGKAHCFAIDGAPYLRAEPKGLAIAGLPAGGVDISASGRRYEPNVTCIRTRAGEVHCFGDGRYGQSAGSFAVARKVDGLPPVVGVGTGGSFACARETSGAIWCWGSNREGGAPDGAPLERPDGVLVDLR